MTRKRPDMRRYFAARIDWHVNGLMARTTADYPAGVVRVDGDVTDPRIVVTMRDGAVWEWAGGQYSARKAHGCYAPRQPRPVG